MTTSPIQSAVFRALKLFALLGLLASTLSITGCACGVLGEKRWGGDAGCAKQVEAERDAIEQKAQRELPALKKRADSGDMKAQVAMGLFHTFESHPNSDRATGLAYYDKAGRQGDLQAQRVFLIESHKDCAAKAGKLGKKETDSPQYAPTCTAEWLALETLAANACVRKSMQDSSSGIQTEIARLLERGGKVDEADFWYVVAKTHCLTAREQSFGKRSGYVASPRGGGSLQEVRVAMWRPERPGDRIPQAPPVPQEVADQADARMALMEGRVAQSGIRPVLGVSPL